MFHAYSCSGLRNKAGPTRQAEDRVQGRDALGHLSREREPGPLGPPPPILSWSFRLAFSEGKGESEKK